MALTDAQKAWGKASFRNPKRKPDSIVWAPRDPGKGNTYAIDGATGEPVKSTWPKCGHSCKQCWPEGPELS